MLLNVIIAHSYRYCGTFMSFKCFMSLSSGVETKTLILIFIYYIIFIGGPSAVVRNLLCRERWCLLVCHFLMKVFIKTGSGLVFYQEKSRESFRHVMWIHLFWGLHTLSKLQWNYSNVTLQNGGNNQSAHTFSGGADADRQWRHSRQHLTIKYNKIRTKCQ